MRRLALSVPGLLVLLAATASSASATTICVPSLVTGCTSATTSLQQALQDADSPPGPNMVKIAAGTYDNNGCGSPSPGGGVFWNFSTPVTIVGAGIGQT